MKQYINLIILIFTCLIFYTSTISATPYMSEINFQENEFIEIYSDTLLNLSNKLVYDDKGIEKANILKLMQAKQTPYYLIASEDFIDNNNIDNLNCTIYSTQKSKIGYYGLNRAGENITISINESLNISWTKQEDLNFENTNQSLNYNTSQQQYFITTQSPCRKYNIIYQNNSKQQNTTNNINQTNQTIINNCNNIFFKINPYHNFTQTKIEYSFKTNATNFTISYWIEDFLGNIAKEKRDTTNKNKKTYTPKSFTEIYKIKAMLTYNNNCTIQDEKQVIFYNKYKETEIQCKETKMSTTIKQENKQLQSYIKILNKEDLKNMTTNILQYEVYKGNTAKRSIYIYQNKHKIASFELEKYSKTKGKIELYLENKNTTMTIEGLEQKDEIVIIDENKKIVSKSKQVNTKIQIQNISTKEEKISFSIATILQKQELLCYINYMKTKVSNINNFNLSQNTIKIKLNINNSKLQQKEQLEKYPLRLTCKYKTLNTTYYKYISENINYTIQNKIKNIEKLITTKYNKSKIETNIVEDEDIKLQYLSNNIIEKTQKELQYTKNSQLSQIQEKDTTIYYTSDNIKQKNNSFYSVFIAISLMFSGFIFIW